MLRWYTTTESACMELPPVEVLGWPAAGFALLRELDRPGRLMLIIAPPRDALALLCQFAALAGQPVTSVSEVALAGPMEWSERNLTERLQGARFLADLECLFWKPIWGIDPLRLCRRMAQKHGVVACWPGEIRDRMARFSAHGRPDHFEVPVSDLVVLRPVPTHFPDEAPFSLMRIPV